MPNSLISLGLSISAQIWPTPIFRARARNAFIRLERDIVSKNGAFARANRDRLKAAGIFTLNLVSSPGSGKTSLLLRTIADLKHRFPISVIEGDRQTATMPVESA
jgi:hypothetical protein